MIDKHLKTIVVTGASSGIGLALTKKCLNLGYRVFATCHKKDILIEALNLTESRKKLLTALHLDIRVADDWGSVFAKVVSQAGKLDILINNAGVVDAKPTIDCSRQDVDFVIDTNVKGSILGCLSAQKIMVDQRAGHIINIGSLAGLSPVPGMALYSASKFALRGFSLSLAMELREKGVYVTLVSPDATRTPMLESMRNSQAANLVFSQPNPLTPDHICDFILTNVLRHKPIEVSLPAMRGIIAKTSGNFPSLASRLSPFMKKVGQKNRERFNETFSKL